MDLYRVGSRGFNVRRIQKALTNAGFGVIDDGWFGVLTEEAVKNFQREKGLKPDGIVGPATLAKMFPEAVGLKKSCRRIDDIIIHCTATPEGRDYPVEQIRADHKKQGWSDIGYHYVIYRDGSIHEGRDVTISGAHCSGHNAHSIGVAYVGGLEYKKGVAYKDLKAKDTRTEKQKMALLSLLIDLKMMYPDARIRGHRDFSPDKNGNGIVEPWEWIKDCPSFDAQKEYSRL